MSFYIVPPMSYQRQQKLKEKENDRKQRRKKRPAGSTSSGGSGASGSSGGGGVEDASSSHRGGHRSDSAGSGPTVIAETPIQLRHSGALAPALAPVPAAAPTSARDAVTFKPASRSALAATPERAAGGPASAPSTVSAPNVAAGIVPPPFRVLTSLAPLNTFASARQVLLTPAYQVQRYHSFLEGLSEFHVSDPIIFANVRKNSLYRFLRRVHPAADAGDLVPSGAGALQQSIVISELALTVASFSLRHTIRQMIHEALAAAPRRSAIVAHEELTQANFTNYIRYLLTLPPRSQTAAAAFEDAALARHYHYKEVYRRIQDELYQLRKAELGGAPADDGAVNSTDLFILAVQKILLEFILLEKYVIQIVCKFGGNHLIEARLLERLFRLHAKRAERARAAGERATAERSEGERPAFRLTKILNYNTFFSAVLSWHLAVLSPFVDVFEMNSYGEDPDAITNLPRYLEARGGGAAAARACPISSPQREQELYNDYFSHLDFGDFAVFKEHSPERLARVQTKVQEAAAAAAGPASSAGAAGGSAGSSSPRAATAGTGGDASSPHKPPNFHYYDGPLSTIPDETFDYIQSRDFFVQVHESSHAVVLRELWRVLARGGTLEIAAIQVGGPNLKAFLASQDGGVCDIDIPNKSNLLAGFVKTILAELDAIFGAGHVRFGFVLINTANDVNMYAITYAFVKLYELAGRIEDFRINTDDDGPEAADDGIHYYIKIVAEKV